jgi:homocysteine S-methyltransferase
MARVGILERLGATGTELEARGFACNSGIWSAAANLNAPGLPREIHEDYLRAGADIITANNYCTSPSFLNRTGEGSRWREYSQVGLEIALAARDAIKPDAYVAGGLSPEGVFGHELTERARLLANGGADFILVEYVPTVSDCVGAAHACAEIDLPLFLGVGNLGADGTLADGTAVETLVDALRMYRVDGLLAMCTFPPAISEWLPQLRRKFAGYVGAYAHGGWAGKPRLSDDAPDFGDQVPHFTPAALADYAHSWKEMGAQVIGGCCGTGPSHIKALPAAVR